MVHEGIKLSLLFTGLTFLLGAFILLMTGAYFKRLHKAKTKWVKVMGVTAGAGIGGSDVAKIYYKFQALDPKTGEVREYHESPIFNIDLGIYPSGKEVPVWYDPEKPERFMAHVFALEPYLVGGLLAMGVFLLSLSFWFATL